MSEDSILCVIVTGGTGVELVSRVVESEDFLGFRLQQF